MHMIDFDGFIIDDKNIFLVEIKEKSPIKPAKYLDDEREWAYGWDTRRLLWYKYIEQKIGINIFYTIRQIDNRDDRNFVKWDLISLGDFLRVVSWSSVRGGGGGEDTLTVPYSHFSDLLDLIRSA